MAQMPYFGLQFIRVDDQAEPVYGANMDVVGIVGPCSTANPEMFPYDTPVLVFSNDTYTIGQLGLDGYIPDAINAINNQLAPFQIVAQMVIVRTRYGTDPDPNIRLAQTIAHVMGSSTSATGIWALTKAPNSLYCTPRLICCPGYTGQMANSLDTLMVNQIGYGYTPNQTYQIIFSPGPTETNGANLVLPQAHATANLDGTIDNDEIVIDAWGGWMTAAPRAVMPAPDGPPILATNAVGQFTFSANPGVGSTITLNTTIVPFVSGTPTGTEVQIGPNLQITLNNLLTMLQASSDHDISQCSYSEIAGSLNLTYRQPGSIGNGFMMASTVTGVSLSGPTLSGGQDAMAPVQCTLTATIALGANPVCASLQGVLDQLIGHAVVESQGVSLIADENWRTTLNADRLIPISGGCKILDPNSGFITVMPLAPRVIGLILARDFATGYPFHSAANQPVQGIVGPARTIQFSLTDGATEGQVLLSANIGILARGLIGVETAISSGGFNFIGTDNAGSDTLWQMYNVMRGRDYIHLSLMPALRTYLGRQNIDRQTVRNVILTIKGFLSNLYALNQILGYNVSFQGALNSADEIRKGHLTVSFAAEEAPVLKVITTMSARYRPAIDAMVQELAAELNFSES